MKYMLSFISGIAIGALLYKFFVSDKKIDDMNEEYENVRKENKKLNKKLDEECSGCMYMTWYDEAKKKEEEEEKHEESDEEGEEEITPYHKIYHTEEKHEETDEEGEEETDEDDDQKAAMEYAKFHEQMIHEPPVCITFEDFINLPYRHFLSEDSMNYYLFDCVLTDSNNEMIEDPETYLGDIIDEYDFDSEPEDSIYVINYQLDTIYQIMIHPQAYSDTL